MQRKFVVKVKGKDDPECHAVTPPGIPYERTKREALDWFDYVLECGKRDVPVEGVRFIHVRIEDTTIATPPPGFDGLNLVPNKAIVLAQYVYDDEPVGPWAKDLVN